MTNTKTKTHQATLTNNNLKVPSLDALKDQSKSVTTVNEPKDEATEPEKVTESKTTVPSEKLPEVKPIERLIRDADYRTKNRVEQIEDKHWRDAMENYVYQRDFITYIFPHPDMMNPLLKIVAYMCPRSEKEINPETGKLENIERLFKVHFDDDYVYYYFYRILTPFVQEGMAESFIDEIREQLTVQFEKEKVKEYRKCAEAMIRDMISKGMVAPSGKRYEKMITEIVQSLINVDAK